MKKIIAFALCLVLLFALAACGNSGVADRLELLERKTDTLEDESLYLNEKVNALEREREELNKELDQLRKENAELENKVEEIQDSTEFMEKIDAAVSMIMSYIVNKIMENAGITLGG